MNAESKIEKWGLTHRIAELMGEGMTTGKAIAEALSAELAAEGKSISPDAVNAYLRKVKPEAVQKANRALAAHLAKVVPDDLEALEELETLCLTWAREEAEPRRERLAEAFAAVSGNVEAWAEALSKALGSDKERRAAVKAMVQRVVAIIQNDADEQARRLAAIRQAVSIIDLKLTKSAMLDEKNNRNIFILPADQSGEGAKAGDGYSEFRIRGGNA
ncbi:MAG: hypothetical protein AB1921_05340 [Thermodesulfobacteriota bacterium]